MPRCFVAIELTGEAHALVAELLERCRADGGDVAWARPDQLHVTLRFLGDVEADRIPDLVAALARVAAATPPFALAVRGTGAFPSAARPRVLWVGVDAAVLRGLAAAVATACAGDGALPGDAPFHGHVTLGRVRQRRGKGRGPWSGRGTRAAGRERGDAGAEVQLAARVTAAGAALRTVASVTEIVLFESTLGPGGSRYRALARWPFTGPSAV